MNNNTGEKGTLRWVFSKRCADGSKLVIALLSFVADFERSIVGCMLHS